MKLYVYTYNTADDPKRRMIGGVASTKAKAQEKLDALKKSFGDFMVDSEINEKELDA